MSETILFLTHTTGVEPQLTKAALEGLAVASKVAQDMGADLFAGLVSGDTDSASKAAAALGAAGVKKVFSVSGTAFAEPRYSSDAAASQAIVQAAGSSYVLAAADFRWSRVIPGLAQRLEGQVDTHVTGIEVVDGKPTVSRWFYRQRMKGSLTRTARPWLMTIEPGLGQAATLAEGNAPDYEVIALELPAEANRTKVLGVQLPEGDDQTIRPEAELLFVAGAGWTKKQADGQVHTDAAQKHILTFINEAKASLGSSKSMVDLSAEGQAVLTFMTHLHQIGQTGSTPRHPKGLATCCHGEEPHAVGWRFIGDRRAINTNPNCGWAQGKADVLYVADAFEVMEKVNALLKDA